MSKGQAMLTMRYAPMRWLWGVMVAALIGGCATVGQLLPFKVSMTRAQMESALIAKAAGTWRMNDFLSLQVKKVGLNLLPQSQRLALDFEVVLEEPLFGTRWPGAINVQAGIRYEPQKGEFVVVEPSIEKLEVAGVSRRITDTAKTLATQLWLPRLSGSSVYRLSEGDQKNLSRFKLRPGSIVIEGEKIVLELVPES